MAASGRKQPLKDYHAIGVTQYFLLWRQLLRCGAVPRSERFDSGVYFEVGALEEIV